ncbi:MAG: FAD-dependent oxidoreductase [Thiohalocapsa sp.]|nr:FAD-dependent oxidoreductase [Thiohalocapsa sp.]MCF7992964.1 FAD-dependent oxidoreductase [Thiohalocapsa sp.]
MTTQYPHIVVGGGISGLSAAHYATTFGVETLLLEANARVGGCMQTYSFPELDGFWIEAGSHSCFNSYGNLLQIMDELGFLDRATPKAKQSYALWREGQRKKILSALHIPELVTSLPRLFTAKKSECSVAEYYGAGLGSRNYRDLFGPAFRSVICQNADDFPAQALFRKKPRRKDVLRSFTMPTGLSEIPRTIAEESGLTVQCDSKVEQITRSDTGFEIALSDGTTLGCDALTLAVPPDAAARLLRDCASRAAEHIANIGVVDIDSLLLAFRKEDLDAPEMAGLISVDGAFLSAVSRDFLDDPRYRGFAFHFPGDLLGEEERVQAACAALGTRPDAIAAAAHCRNKLPSLRKGHAALIEQIDAALAGLSLAVTGNWFLGVSIEDCVSRSLAEHYRLFGAPDAAI